MVNQPIFDQISNLEDFLKRFKNFFNELLTKVAAIFTKAVFEELKKEIKILVALLFFSVSFNELCISFSIDVYGSLDDTVDA
jgi:hypothetical protein